MSTDSIFWLSAQVNTIVRFFLSLSAHIPRLVLSVQGHQTFAQQKTSTKSKKKRKWNCSCKNMVTF